MSLKTTKVSTPGSVVPSRFGNLVGHWASGVVSSFLRKTIRRGQLVLRTPSPEKDLVFGQPNAPADQRVVLKINSWWFFVRMALEHDIGFARAYMAGELEVENEGPNLDGLTKVFDLFVLNREQLDSCVQKSNMLASWAGWGINYMIYHFFLDNSVANSRSNISAHYDVGNEFFKIILDEELMMYSCCLYDLHIKVPASAASGPAPCPKLEFKGTLEEASLRKVDMLIAKARLEPHHTLLDLGCGWGGVSIRAAQTIGCRVVGITLSKEQKALAEERAKAKGVDHLVSFQIIDYRLFAKTHAGAFDRIISCEMVEHVGHQHLGEYFAAVERMLKPEGVFVIEVITTLEAFYEDAAKSPGFINTIVFPGCCCPSIAALLDAAANHSKLSLEGLVNLDVHYAETLREWRRRMNAKLDVLRAQGFDDVFFRCFNYYLCYCEAASTSKTLGTKVMTMARPGNMSVLTNMPCTVTGGSGHSLRQAADGQ